jgi:O-antigen ligase
MNVSNPMLGVGYESFWLLPNVVVDTYGLNQSHNGYIETYLNLGVTGVVLLMGAVFFALYRNVLSSYHNYPMAYLGIVLIVVSLFYNWTEAMFHGVNNVWLLLLFSLLDPGKPSRISHQSHPVASDGR